MKIIYEPKGRAAEYAPLAVNLYGGCSHGCRYCFGPGALRKKRATFNNNIQPKKDALIRVRKDAERLRGDEREILMSIVSDPYQPADHESKNTRNAIKILIENDLTFTILTKGGTRAVRDFDLLQGYEKARFGSTLIFTQQKYADICEPNAPTIKNRIEAIKEANKRGISTWVSLEPVIDPNQALELIWELHPIVGHWKVGKLNYNKEIERQVDWLAFRDDVAELLESLNASYYIKKSLTEL